MTQDASELNFGGGAGMNQREVSERTRLPAVSWRQCVGLRAAVASRVEHRQEGGAGSGA